MATRRVETMRKETSDVIAASYVVPDLVVAVQEAVYNAIDAHASNVRVVVDVAQATFSVTDDGDGIHPDEMYEHLFECNATSKMDRSTRKYGHRGQFLLALAKLAKQVELESRVETHWTSFRKVVENTLVVFNARSKTTKTTKGTTLRVQSLFWQLPVRQRELEAHASARIRLARRLSSFFRSISMIWPSLSIDVSFTDTKVPRNVIPGASSCEERLRRVFGDILGSELEYIKCDFDDLPFTIRGFAGVVRDAGDGDANLESTGWRQARAYYQYVFLDNLWLEDFQQECCKTINHAAIGLDLGVLIFVLKVSAKTHEYELHSDGHTRVVNLKRPELFTQTMRRFAQMLQARVVEADASLAAMALDATADNATETKLMPGHGEDGSKGANIDQMPEMFDHEAFGDDEAVAFSQEMAEQYEPDQVETPTEATRTETEALDLEVEREEMLLSGYGDQEFYDGGSDVQQDYYNRHTHQTMPVEHTTRWSAPSPMVYADARPSSTVAFEQVYAEEHNAATSYAGYHGCSHCGSCGGYDSTSRYVSDHQHSMVYYQPVGQTAARVSHHARGPPPCAYESLPQLFDYDTSASGYERVGPATAINHTSRQYDERQYFEYGESASSYHTKVAADVGSFLEAEDMQQRVSVPTTAQSKHQQAFDQLFFGKSLPRERPRRRASSRRTELPQGGEEDAKVDEGQWVSSRRIGVLPTEDPAPSPGEDRQFYDNSASTETTIAESGPHEKAGESHKSTDPTKKDQADEQESECGSVQLSEYFSLEKLAKAGPRSLGKAISKFASKRTALGGLVGSCGLEPSPTGVHVAQLPSNLHAPTAKTMTIDKSLLRHLQVIKQVDRKFILVKATLESVAPSGDTPRTLLLCIDQHAADERVRLEQFELQVFGVHGDERNVEVESHAPPLVLSLNMRERETLRLFADEIRAWGFGVENTESDPLVLTHTPRIHTRVASGGDFREYLQLLACSDVTVARRVLRPPVVTRLLHSRACRSAIMFGDYLSFSQCEDIVKQLRHCHLPFQCAHGRPSIVPLAELA